MPNLPRRVLQQLALDGFRPGPAGDPALTERSYAGLRLLVLDARRAARYRPRAAGAEVCISIRDPGTSPLALSSRFAEVLTLEFEDTGSYADYVEQGRDNPRGITQEQAAAVAAFVLRHRHRRAIVLHCAAGVSRSRSMAAAITEALKLPYEFTAVNDDVHRAVRRALLDARTSAKAEAVHRLFGAAAGGTSDDPRGEYRGHLRRKHGAGSEPPE